MIQQKNLQFIKKMKFSFSNEPKCYLNKKNNLTSVKIINNNLKIAHFIKSKKNTLFWLKEFVVLLNFLLDQSETIIIGSFLSTEYLFI
jgi:hypothetical protein